MVNRNELVSYLHLCPTDFFSLGCGAYTSRLPPLRPLYTYERVTHEMAK